jgi:hypothetical protein
MNCQGRLAVAPRIAGIWEEIADSTMQALVDYDQGMVCQTMACSILVEHLVDIPFEIGSYAHLPGDTMQRVCGDD